MCSGFYIDSGSEGLLSGSVATPRKETERTSGSREARLVEESGIPCTLEYSLQSFPSNTWRSSGIESFWAVSRDTAATTRGAGP